MPENFDIKKSVRILQDYMNTYTNQRSYKKYSKETFIDDILYGLGISLNEEYTFRDGYEKFKKKLIEHISKEKK